MSNYHIHTKLNLHPSTNCHCKDSFIVTKGASADFILSFEDYSYLKPSEGEAWYTYIEQVTFIFKQPGKSAEAFNLFAVYDEETGKWIPTRKSDQDYGENEGPSIDPHFAYDADNECISLLVSADETAEWDVTEDGEEVKFEIAIDTDTYSDRSIIGQNTDSIIIEKQDSVIVVDSLYREWAYGEN